MIHAPTPNSLVKREVEGENQTQKNKQAEREKMTVQEDGGGEERVQNLSRTETVIPEKRQPARTLLKDHLLDKSMI